jgi:large subunit ribosomal protein L35
MPKAKTNRGAAKRLIATKSGRIVRKKAGHSHLLRKKNAKRRRRLRQSEFLSGSVVSRVKKMIPKI